MDNLYGIWLNDSTYDTTHIKTQQTINADGSFETHMSYLMDNGCQQDIFHVGKFELNGKLLKLMITEGHTAMSGCADATSNFAKRPFTEEEFAETKAMLAQEIQVNVEGDTLTTIVSAPTGSMEVRYERQKA